MRRRSHCGTLLQRVAGLCSQFSTTSRGCRFSGAPRGPTSVFSRTDHALLDGIVPDVAQPRRERSRPASGCGRSSWSARHRRRSRCLRRKPESCLKMLGKRLQRRSTSGNLDAVRRTWSGMRQYARRRRPAWSSALCEASSMTRSRQVLSDRRRPRQIARQASSCDKRQMQHASGPADSEDSSRERAVVASGMAFVARGLKACSYMSVS